MKKWLCPLLVAGKVSQIVSHRKGRFRYEDRPIHKGCIERHGNMSGVHRLHSGQLATKLDCVLLKGHLNPSVKSGVIKILNLNCLDG